MHNTKGAKHKWTISDSSKCDWDRKHLQLYLLVILLPKLTQEEKACNKANGTRCQNMNRTGKDCRHLILRDGSPLGLSF